jgi:DNA topoisomerase IA
LEADVACQMADARKQRITVTIEGGGATFTASGTSIEFEGFLRAYVEGSDDPEAELADKETLLPAVKANDPLASDRIDPKGHTTQPPARYSEASLTRALEEKGIGRPSTYASIIDTIQARNYVYKKGNALVPSWTAFLVIRVMEEHFKELVDYEFTAQMEDFSTRSAARKLIHRTTCETSTSAAKTRLAMARSVSNRDLKAPRSSRWKWPVHLGNVPEGEPRKSLSASASMARVSSKASSESASRRNCRPTR